MQMKKVVSLIMVLAMMLTIAVIPATFSAADTDVASTGLDYALAPNIQSGNILHAFDWRMRDLVKYAPEIAQAGYTTVQISPIQKTKAAANAGAYSTDWWSFYQPTDMTIGNALGTAEELNAATTELHKYGIKVVADVVTNHVQNCQLKAEIQNIAPALTSTSTGVRNSNLLKHTLVASDNSRQAQVQGDLNGELPDLNTGLKAYQNYVINNLLNPLADNGVDGFRFDAAKHIETPDDGTYASDYWPTITSAIKSKNANAYIYGEVLATGGQFQITSYTKYMNVTDYNFGNVVRNALKSKSASNLVNYGYSGTSKNQNVLWVESHDNFCDNTSTSLTKKQQILGWAVVGSRADAPALFFVRPKHEALDSAGFIKYDELMGAPGAADTWKDPTVVAVNKFKNAFAGQSETTTASGANLFVQRGIEGMVIVNLNGSSTSVSQSCSMKNGTYKDQVSGATFTVSGGKITGTVGSTGVAVVYNTTADNSSPEITLSLNGTVLTPEVLSRYTGATADIKVTLKNATSGTIKVSNLAPVTVENGETTFKLNSSIPYGKSVDITVTATNGSKNTERTYNIKKKDANETKKVYFDNASPQWATPYLVAKTGEAAGTCISGYGFGDKKMTLTSGTVYSADVPATANYVKFSVGPTTEHLGHKLADCGGFCGPTFPETVINYGTANLPANRERGGYKLEGAMIFRDLRFEDYGEYPVATLTAADTTLAGEVVPTEPPTEPGVRLLRGDTDLNDDVDIFDATLIQRFELNMITLSENAQKAADVNSDDEANITDVTWIQRYLADMNNPHKVGSYFYTNGGDAPAPTPTQAPTAAPQPTQAPTAAPTSAPVPDPTQAPTEAKALVKLPNKFVVIIYCEAAGTDDASRNSEHALDEYGTLTYDFEGPSYVFARNYDTGVQYCTDGWTNFEHPVELVNENNLTADFNKMYVPAGTHKLILQPGEGDTYTLDYE